MGGGALLMRAEETPKMGGRAAPTPKSKSRDFSTNAQFISGKNGFFEKYTAIIGDN